MAPTHARRRAFTLVELIVVVLVIGVLAAVAMFGYGHITTRAEKVAAQQNVRTAAQAVHVDATLERPPGDVLTRERVLQVLTDSGSLSVVDGLHAADGAWVVLGAHESPAGSQDLAVGFDFGDGVANDVSGTRVALLSAGGDGPVYARVITSDGSAVTVGAQSELPAGATPADALSRAAAPGPSPAPVVEGMTMTWDTQAPSCGRLTVALPLSGVVTGTVDWGDGTTGPLTANASHTYAAPGRYPVVVAGTFTEISMEPVLASAPCLISVDEWGQTETVSATRAFQQARNLVAVAAPPASVTRYDYMFYGATSFNGDVSSWQTSSVTTLRWMFAGAAAFNGDVSGWDVSRVTNLEATFMGAEAFNRDLSGWDVSGVTNLGSTFARARAFNGDVSSWDTANVTSLISTFQSATAFAGDVSRWNTSKVTAMDSTFAEADAFAGDLSSWDTSSVRSMVATFAYATRFNSDISGWDVARVGNVAQLFAGASSFNQDLSGWVLPVPAGAATSSGYDDGAIAWTAARPVFAG